MNSKDLDNIVVISSYDNGYEFSILENGTIHKRLDGHRHETLIDAYSYIYNHSKLKEIFPNKTIIVCEDGDIEVIK